MLYLWFTLPHQKYLLPYSAFDFYSCIVVLIRFANIGISQTRSHIHMHRSYRGAVCSFWTCILGGNWQCILFLYSDGKPLQVVQLDTDKHRIKLDEKLLGEILSHEEVQNTKVMLLSVSGAFRQGKSFLLNFFIKYLNALECGIEV